MQHPSPPPPSDPCLGHKVALPWWRRGCRRFAHWWRGLSPARQDPFAALAPTISVLLFMVAVVASVGYLHVEESGREREALRRDALETQQRLQLRLLERQEQLQRMARYIVHHELTAAGFSLHVDGLVRQHPDLRAITWVDAAQRVVLSHFAPNTSGQSVRVPGQFLHAGHTLHGWQQARQTQQPVFVQPPSAAPVPQQPLLQLHVPLLHEGEYQGELLGEYSVDSLLRYGADSSVMARYAVSLLDHRGQWLAGAPLSKDEASQASSVLDWLPWRMPAQVWQAPLLPAGDDLVLRVQGWRASTTLVGHSLFGVTALMSVLTAWLLVANWLHLRRRRRAQAALLAETSFRRAMENSVLTGMRAMDLHGRVTYVNAAFCRMTGFGEEELLGETPPYAYWPAHEHEELLALLRQKFTGDPMGARSHVRMQRKDGTQFDARLYISALVDAQGRHTGWMTSMTDITEPNRIREQLSAAHQRFTIVLEALDASVSVAALGSSELLFANKRYRQWFGGDAQGHLLLVAQAGSVPQRPGTDRSDGDATPGSADEQDASRRENPEIHHSGLDKWLEVRSRYLHWADGRLVQMVIASDITARRLAQEQAARQAEHAQTVSRLISMGEMASSVAHELNQPLAAISNYCAGLLARLNRGELNPAQMQFALQKTAHQAQRAGQIIQHIRAFVKRSAPRQTRVQVADMVGEALELIRIELRRRNVQLTHHTARRMPAVLADAILIEQVLVNLMKNGAEAIDQAARPAHQRQLELRVRPRRLDSGQHVIEFIVQDSGGGLPPQVLQRLFEAFFSTKSEGMGMGLNLCRSIVESHQGRLSAENVYRGTEIIGCRFSFWLPVAQDEPPPEFHLPKDAACHGQPGEIT